MRKRRFNTIYGKLSLFTAVILVSILSGCNKDIVEPNPVSDEAWTTEKSAHTTEPGLPELLVSGLQGGSGSTVGPGGAIYVTESAAGRVSRIDPKTGVVTTFADGLPPLIPPVGIGGAMDVAFIGSTAYVLVTLVDEPDLFPTDMVNGIYRVDGPNDFTIIADIGEYNLNHPPTGFPFFVKTGVLYSIQAYRGGFLVNDGHFNRVLHVTTDGDISIFKEFDNIVPTGLDVSGNTIYMSEAGPTPHLPENGKVVSFSPNSPNVTKVASGAPLLVDVEFGRGRTLFALAQGKWEGTPGVDDGSPALPGGGSLVRANSDGSFTTIADGLDRPTSLEIINNTAYVVTLTGEVWTIDNIASPPFGK